MLQNTLKENERKINNFWIENETWFTGAWVRERERARAVDYEKYLRWTLSEN